jgi:hypothetical protein
VGREEKLMGTETCMPNLWDEELHKNFMGAVTACQKTCADCEHGFKCQTGSYGEEYTLVQEPVPGWRDWGRGYADARHNAEIFFLKNCIRPLGILRRQNVSIDIKFEYMWVTPFVPVQVKLDMLRELAVWHLNYTAGLPDDFSRKKQAMQAEAVDIISDAIFLWRAGHRNTDGRRRLEDANLSRLIPYVIEMGALAGFISDALAICTGGLWRMFEPHETFPQDCYTAALRAAETIGFDDDTKRMFIGEQAEKQRQIGECIKLLVLTGESSVKDASANS